MIRYWCTFLLSEQTMLINHPYRIMYNTDNSTNWLNKIKNILDTHGVSDIWINQSFSSKTWSGLTIKQRAKDQFIQEWQNMLGSNKGSMYLNIRSSFESRITYCKFRTGNHNLPVEAGRWEKPKIDHEKRLWDLYHKYIGDEYHFL